MLPYQTMDDSKKGTLFQAVQHFQHYVLSNGVANLKEVASGILEKLSEEPLHVAVVGRQCAQKSNFIDALVAETAFGIPYGSLHRSRDWVRRFSSYNPEESPFIQKHKRRTSLKRTSPSYTRSVSSGWGLDTLDDVENKKEGILTKSQSTKSFMSPSWASLPENEDHQKAKERPLSMDEGVFGSDDESPESISSVLPDTPNPEPLPPIDLLQRTSDIVFHDLGELPTLPEPDDVSLACCYDVYLVFSGSRFVDGNSLNSLKALSNVRNTLFANSCIGTLKNPTQAFESHQEIRGYFRQKFFRHHLWNIPAFLVFSDETQLYEFPDLLRQMTKLQKRKNRHRRRLLRESAISVLPKMSFDAPWRSKVLSVMSAICSSVAAYPILPILADISSFIYRWKSYRQCLDKDTNPIPDDLTNRDSSFTSAAKNVLLACPATWAWVFQRLAARAFQVLFDDTPEITPILVGAGSLVGYFLSQSSSMKHINRCHKNAKWVIITTMKSRLSEPCLASTPSSRATSKASSQRVSRSSSPSIKDWYSREQ